MRFTVFSGAGVGDDVRAAEALVEKRVPSAPCSWGGDDEPAPHERARAEKIAGRANTSFGSDISRIPHVKPPRATTQSITDGGDVGAYGRAAIAVTSARASLLYRPSIISSVLGG